jgi:hypothetical protein
MPVPSPHYTVVGLFLIVLEARSGRRLVSSGSVEVHKLRSDSFRWPLMYRRVWFRERCTVMASAALKKVLRSPTHVGLQCNPTTSIRHPIHMCIPEE